jgi:hypothetical protein
MAKTIIRETIIILLLCLAIILVLGVVLYNYVPTNKIVPEQVSYTQTEEVKNAIEESAVDNTQVILTYEIDETDLNNYEKVRDYKPGKTNPFSSYQKDENETTEQTNTVNTTNTANGENNQTTNNTTSGNTNNVKSGTTENSTTTENKTLFPDNGTK